MVYSAVVHNSKAYIEAVGSSLCKSFSFFFCLVQRCMGLEYSAVHCAVQFEARQLSEVQYSLLQ